QKALNHATRLAQHFGSKLTILHIHEDHFVFENTISPETAKAPACGERFTQNCGRHSTGSFKLRHLFSMRPAPRKDRQSSQKSATRFDCTLNARLPLVKPFIVR